MPNAHLTRLLDFVNNHVNPLDTEKCETTNRVRSVYIL
jgi:hypothetical protein